MRQTTIYIGLNDAETHKQKFDTEKYLSILKGVCHAYHTAFSIHSVDGGYFHEDGSYVEEKTLALTLLDAPKEKIEEMAKDLCAFFHQESVLVTNSVAEAYYISERLEQISPEQ